MEKNYKGYIVDQDRWEIFGSKCIEDATPEASGYDKVIDLESGRELLNDLTLK